jgi:tetratricopeptide (TPR) repeat protein
MALLGGGANAQSPKIDARNLDAQAQWLKAQVLKRNRDLLTLTEELLYPAATRVSVFLSVDGSEPFQLAAVELKIDGEVVVRHRYSEREANALLRGGVQRIYSGNSAEGEHELTAVVTGKNAKGRDYRESAAMIFYKETAPKLIELAIVNLKGRDHPEMHAPASVRDRQLRAAKEPSFGEALFNLYQEKYFAAATGLMAARESGELSHHYLEAALLLGDLYLSYGLHQEAESMFARLALHGVPPDINARAQFDLAKSWYQRGYLREAQDTLLDIRDTVPSELQDERRVLLALVLMNQNRYGEGVGVLTQLRGRSEWATYARYNMGVGLIQIGRRSEGISILEKIARMRRQSEEIVLLRDKANLALGFTFLGVPDPERARAYFREVRFNGPFSNKALLGIGWALSAKGKHKQSLVPWMELQNRGDVDVAVQESLLAVPYALSQLQAYKQALQHYENAITTYNAEIESLARAVEALRAGERLSSVVQYAAAAPTAPAGRPANTPENRYLVRVFASHGFQGTLRNYRDLRSLSKNLDCWAAALAGEEEQNLPARLKAAKRAIADRENDTDPADDSQACGRINGSRHWQLAPDYKPSLWRVNEPYLQSEDEYTRAKTRATAAEDAQRSVDPGHGATVARIGALHRRVTELKASVDSVVDSHERFLQQLAALELESQEKRLRTYVAQARFGIAQVYDQSSRRAGQTQ